MIKPTVGRVVHFRVDNPHDELFKFTRSHGVEQPMAAHVTYVWNDRMINVMVIDPNGRSHPRTSVILLQDDDAKPDRQNFCTWMDYQKGQAAKYEALEKQVTGIDKIAR